MLLRWIAKSVEATAARQDIPAQPRRRRSNEHEQVRECGAACLVDNPRRREGRRGQAGVRRGLLGRQPPST